MEEHRQMEMDTTPRQTRDNEETQTYKDEKQGLLESLTSITLFLGEYESFPAMVEDYYSIYNSRKGKAD